MEENKDKLISRKKQKKNLKEKREKMYQSINHECAKINTSEIRIEDFVESRKKELRNFNHILKNKYNSKTGFQLLPKHMRRRCMSHNPFRVPVRLRLGEIKTVIKTKQFKHKRKRRNLRKSILKRALLNNWFESHLWLVKRFKMKHKFGYLIPFKRRDKSFKACYRYFKYDAVVNDCSHFNYLTLKLTNNLENLNNNNITNLEYIETKNVDFIHLIKLLLDKLTLQKDLINFTINTNAISNNNKTSIPQEEDNKILESLNFKNFETNIYNFETGNLIGPCTLIILDGKLIIKFNSLIANELTENLLNFKNRLFRLNENLKNKDLEIHYSKNLNTYKLLGPRSGSRLFKILNSLSAFDAFLPSESENNKEAFLRNKENLEMFFSNETGFEKLLELIPNGEVLFFKIKKPSTEFKMNEFCFSTFYNKLVKMTEEANKKENSEEEQTRMLLDEEVRITNDKSPLAEALSENKKTKLNDSDYLKIIKHLFSKNNNNLVSDITQNIMQEESIELTDLAEIKQETEEGKQKMNSPNGSKENKDNKNNGKDNKYKTDIISNTDNKKTISEKIETSLQIQKQRLINITQKKHLLRKFTSILNTYTERGPLVHRRKLKLSDLNDKVEESQLIDKRKILDYFSLQRKSTHKNLSFNDNNNINSENKTEMKLKKIVNNTITENINNYKIEHIKKILHTQSESYLIILKNGLITSKNNDNPNGSVYTSVPVYDLIFPSGFSSDMLRRFHYIETKVIGLKELNYFLTECGQSIFPDDYPSTKAYCECIKQKTINKIGKYCKYPPSKRSNFQKLSNPFPFYPAWDTLGKILKAGKVSCANSIANKSVEANRMEIDCQDKNENLVGDIINNHNDDYFDKFNFYKFNANSLVIENIKNKNSIRNQMELQLLRDPKLKNLWVRIQFEMQAKGNPQYNALICLPSKDDFQKMFELLKFSKRKKYEANSTINSNLSNSNKIDFSKSKIINLLNNPMQKDFILSFESNKKIKNSIMQPVSKTEIKNKDFNTEFKIYRDLLENNNLHTIKYNSNILDFNFNVKVDGEILQKKIIGFVTSGHYSYMNHKGIGKGFIDLKSFEEILKIKQEINAKIKEESEKMKDEIDVNYQKFVEEIVRLNLVLIRNPGSRYYYFAKFTY